MGCFRSSVACLLLAASALAPAGAGAAGTGDPPSCAEGPARVGSAIEGTPCADTIVAPLGVASVSGGGGDDTIVPGPIAAATSCPQECRLGVGSQTFEGGPGDDVVFGERGNDTLLGGGGNDKLFGGPGDDLVRGGAGDDLLSGGFGADTIDGEEGNDYVRGDATIDHLRDAGPAADVDTLSYSTGISPGFTRAVTNPGFPAKAEEGRGVYLDLAEGLGDNGVAPNGGGVDEVEGADFERIVGSPFSDYIEGSKAGQAIYGGGGADVLVSGGAGTALNGGADGDNCVGSTAIACESTASNGPVGVRPAGAVSVGSMTEGASGYTELYLLGSASADGLSVDSTGGAPGELTTFHLTGGASFEAPPAASGCVLQNGTTAVCTLAGRLDSLLVAGLGGGDNIHAEGLPATTSSMALGGQGDDGISAGDKSEDILVDGPGNDALHGGGGDDAVVGNAGDNALSGDGGNDLFLSNAICEGSTIEGGLGRDNASWARFSEAVAADLATGKAGRSGGAGTPSCATGSLDTLHGIEDLEGSNSADAFHGDGGANQLLGHEGADSYHAEAGEDLILANASDADAAIDCGADTDIAIVDFAQFGDPTPVDCESAIEAERDDFDLPPPEIPPPPLEPPPPPEASAPPEPTSEPPPTVVPDTIPPQTRLGARPGKLLTTRTGRRLVAFRFASSEPGSRFRCRLDGQPFRFCTSPSTYVVRPGRHAFRVTAIDPAGNVDRTPVLFRFHVQRR